MHDITFSVEALAQGRWVITAKTNLMTETLVGVYETEIFARRAIDTIARRWLEDRSEDRSSIAA